MYLFFDTETTGLPKNYNGKATDLDNWPRVIQIAWQLYSSTGVLIDERCSLIRPDGWTIPKEKFWIDNGYSTEKSLLEGKDAFYEFSLFAEKISECVVLIAHNLSFDTPIVQAEMIRYGISATRRPERKLCRMKATTNICKIPSSRGYKWPKLEELHMYLFGSKFDNAHDALADVRATARCAFELQKRELIVL